MTTRLTQTQSQTTRRKQPGVTSPSSRASINGLPRVKSLDVFFDENVRTRVKDARGRTRARLLLLPDSPSEPVTAVPRVPLAQLVAQQQCVFPRSSCKAGVRAQREMQGNLQPAIDTASDTATDDHPVCAHTIDEECTSRTLPPGVDYSVPLAPQHVQAVLISATSVVADEPGATSLPLAWGQPHASFTAPPLVWWASRMHPSLLRRCGCSLRRPGLHYVSAACPSHWGRARCKPAVSAASPIFPPLKY